MARTVKRVYPEDLVWFVPDIDDNRSDPAPFRVKLSPLSASDMRRANEGAVRRAIEDKGIESVGSAASLVMDDIVRDHVVEVENYAVEDKSGRVTRPSSGHELVDAILAGPPSEDAIIAAIYEALRNVSSLSEAALGNSPSPHDSSPRPTPRAESGSAADASSTATSAPSRSPTGTGSAQGETAAASQTQNSGSIGTEAA